MDLAVVLLWHVLFAPLVVQGKTPDPWTPWFKLYVSLLAALGWRRALGVSGLLLVTLPGLGA